MLNHKYVVSACFASVVGLLSGPALAGGGGPGNCGSLPTWQQLKSALVSAVNAGGNGGLGFNMWGAIVDNSGIVCAVAFSGADFTAQWLGSRMIAAQKANTGNAFSLAKTSPPAFSLFKTGLLLRFLRARSTDELLLVVGADIMLEKDCWASFEEVEQLAQLVVVDRVGYPPVAGGAPLPEISSTDLRERFAQGLPVKDLVPAAVERYVREKGLYSKR